MTEVQRNGLQRASAADSWFGDFYQAMRMICCMRAILGEPIACFCEGTAFLLLRWAIRTTLLAQLSGRKRKYVTRVTYQVCQVTRLNQATSDWARHGGASTPGCWSSATLCPQRDVICGTHTCTLHHKAITLSVRIRRCECISLVVCFLSPSTSQDFRPSLCDNAEMCRDKLQCFPEKHPADNVLPDTRKP